MRFVSTRGGVPPTDLRTAVLAGPAPDGGLYVPETVPRLTARELDGLRNLPFPALSVRVLHHLLGDHAPDFLEEVVHAALDFPLPLIPRETGSGVPEAWIGELFHGPTGAFKDVGARFLAHLTAALRHSPDEGLLVLVATSGDTGSAVARAFGHIPGCRAVVAFPKGRISGVQENQICGAGPGVRPLAVEGSFDDCQRLVREVLAAAPHGPPPGSPAHGLHERVALVSGNSINVGRLLPQALYYFHFAFQLPPRWAPPVFAVPSGNLGNLTAGLLARAAGLPTGGFVAATNRNDTVVGFLESGTLDETRSSVPTLSSAMDVALPSNLERALHLFGGASSSRARASMAHLVLATTHSDEDTLALMRSVHERTGYLLDPHTAVGLLGLLEARTRPLPWEGPGIVLATAHPAKFAPAVREATGISPTAPASWDQTSRMVSPLAIPAESLSFQEAVAQVAREVGG
ncbi:MAG: threonine synthase [Gemmatimonadota bacterium]